MTDDFKKKNLFDIKLKNPHGIYKLKEFLIVCDTHNHRILFLKMIKFMVGLKTLIKIKLVFIYMMKKNI